jgi:beta-mannosidase
MTSLSLAGKWQFRQAGTDEWLPARVPGSVHTDLLALGRIPDPFVADNELRVRWVAERDWEYRLTFPVAPDRSAERPGRSLLAEERVFLVCDGLDTLADVTFNGQPVGHAENMFRRYRWDVRLLPVSATPTWSISSAARRART